MNIEIANRLVQLRKKNGLSQEELAARLGISRQAVSKWERAESSPDTDNLILLSRLYNISLDELLSTSDEIPTPEPEDTPGDEHEKKSKRGGDYVNIGFNGIHVEREDGDTVHIGWDGIYVNDGIYANEREACGDAAVKCSKDGVYVKDGGNSKRAKDMADGITDIRPGDEGVRFNENGKEKFCAYNTVWGKGKRYVRQEYDSEVKRWITLIITDKGKKTVIVSKDRPDNMGRSTGDSVKKGFLAGFPFAVMVTVAFLLLGFLGDLWHPAWMLFLTIPVYYTIYGALKGGSLRSYDIIVPAIIIGAYVVIGLATTCWSPTWLMLLAIPVYLMIAAAARGGNRAALLNAGFAVLVSATYIAVGFLFGKGGWACGWLLFFLIPMFASITNSISQRRGIRTLTVFPWEVLITAVYLFMGIMFDLWHPGWVIFMAIPILRWALNAIVKAVTHNDSSDDDDHDDYDDDDE